MYTVDDYGRMVAERARTEAYVRALEQVIKAGDVVVDLGAGSGIFSLYACRFGARRVYAIEPEPTVSLLREVARLNGYEDRIVVLQKRSTEVTLEEQADVIVGDMRGSSPLFGRNAALVRDARVRFLRAGGIVLPREDTLFAGLVSSSELYGDLVDPWSLDGFDQTPLRDDATSTVVTDREFPITAEQCVSTAAPWFVLDYSAGTDAPVVGHCELVCTRDALVHGLAVWFSAKIWGDIGYANPPGTRMVYKRLFLPWPAPRKVARGEAVSVRIDALPGGDDYVFSWKTSFADGVTLKQSEWSKLQLGASLSKDSSVTA